MKKEITYKGHTISRNENGYYYTIIFDIDSFCNETSNRLMADTLIGIKKLITERKNKLKKYL